MVEGSEGVPPVKRKRGRPRKADVIAAQAAAAAGEGANGGGWVAPNENLAAKPQPKPRKPRKKKGDILAGAVGVDTNLVGRQVTGVLDGSFDAGYLLTVRVGDTETVMRGVVFAPSLISSVIENDVAPHVKTVMREETMPLPALPAPPTPVVSVAPAAAPAPQASTAAVPATVQQLPAPIPLALAVATPVSPAAAAEVEDIKPQVLHQATSSRVEPTPLPSTPLSGPAGPPTGA